MTVSSGGGGRRRRSGPPLIRETTPGKLPPSSSLSCPRAGSRRCCISATNATCFDPAGATCRTSPSSETVRSSSALPQDILQADLDGLRRGWMLHRPVRGARPGRDRRQLRAEPRPALRPCGDPSPLGVQIKAPMCLTAEGHSGAGNRAAASHYSTKPAGTRRLRSPAAGRRVPLSCAWSAAPRARGAQAAADHDARRHAPGAGRSSGSISASSAEDRRMLAMEDFCPSSTSRPRPNTTARSSAWPGELRPALDRPPGRSRRPCSGERCSLGSSPTATCT